MVGGGFGGSAIALVDADAVDAVTAAVVARFAARGVRPAAHVRRRALRRRPPAVVTIASAQRDQG